MATVKHFFRDLSYLRYCNKKHLWLGKWRFEYISLLFFEIWQQSHFTMQEWRREVNNGDGKTLLFLTHCNFTLTITSDSFSKDYLIFCFKIFLRIRLFLIRGSVIGTCLCLIKRIDFSVGTNKLALRQKHSENR